VTPLTSIASTLLLGLLGPRRRARRPRRSGRQQPRQHLAPAGDLAPRPADVVGDRPEPAPVERWRYGCGPNRAMRRRVDAGRRVEAATPDDGANR
jgi:hypothetical protein